MVDLLSRYPDGLTLWQLMDLIYADDIGGGATNRNVVPVMAHWINLQLKSQGYKITATGGPGSVYRLVQTNGS